MASRKLKHAKQSNRSSGCGPACLAMLSGRTEADAVKAIFGEPRKRRLLTEWPDLKRGMEVLGVAFNGPAKRVGSWSNITTTAIVGCGKNETAGGGERWHWVVFQPDGTGSGLVYDPAHDSPYVPTARNRKPFSYLPVTPRK